MQFLPAIRVLHRTVRHRRVFGQSFGRTSKNDQRAGGPLTFPTVRHQSHRRVHGNRDLFPVPDSISRSPKGNIIFPSHVGALSRESFLRDWAGFMRTTSLMISRTRAVPRARRRWEEIPRRRHCNNRSVRTCNVQPKASFCRRQLFLWVAIGRPDKELCKEVPIIRVII